MPDDRDSPSAGWREVYEAMDADAGVEEPAHPCPDCGRTCENVLQDVYECEEHGVFQSSASNEGEERSADGSEAHGNDETGDGDPPGTDEGDDTENRAKGPAD